MPHGRTGNRDTLYDSRDTAALIEPDAVLNLCSLTTLSYESG